MVLAGSLGRARRCVDNTQAERPLDLSLPAKPVAANPRPMTHGSGSGTPRGRLSPPPGMTGTLPQGKGLRSKVPASTPRLEVTFTLLARRIAERSPERSVECTLLRACSSRMIAVARSRRRASSAREIDSPPRCNSSLACRPFRHGSVTLSRAYAGADRPLPPRWDIEPLVLHSQAGCRDEALPLDRQRAVDAGVLQVHRSDTPFDTCPGFAPPSAPSPLGSAHLPTGRLGPGDLRISH
jgi:hypothetical protein